VNKESVFLTPNERIAYEDRLRRLMSVELPALQARMRRLEALEKSHRDEDEYDNTIDDYSGVQGAIPYLQKFLERARQITAEDARAAGYVRLDSRVLARTNDGVNRCYAIAGPFEYDPSEGQFVMHDSPIGQALMNGVPGQIVVVKAPANTFTLEILRVEQSPKI